MLFIVRGLSLFVFILFGLFKIGSWKVPWKPLESAIETLETHEDPLDFIGLLTVNSTGFPQELKPEDAETGPAWSIKHYGDEGVSS